MRSTRARTLAVATVAAGLLAGGITAGATDVLTGDKPSDTIANAAAGQPKNPSQARGENAANAAAALPDEDALSGRTTYYLKFDKNTVTNSRLSLMQSVVGPDKVVKSYKAGSGVIEDPCAGNAGWLPNGDYEIEFHQKNFVGKINGYVIKVSDKRCHNGTKRDALFIHSEMKSNGSQGTAETKKWTTNNPNDYTSWGCIKLNPSNIKDLFNKMDSVGWKKLTKLKVIS